MSTHPPGSPPHQPPLRPGAGAKASAGGARAARLALTFMPVLFVLLPAVSACAGIGVVWIPDGPGVPETGSGEPPPGSEDHQAQDEDDEEQDQDDQEQDEQGDDEASPEDPEVRSFVTLLNEHRISIGCPALVFHARAADVALAHSRDMAEREFFDHTNPDGERFSDRLRAAGVAYTLAGENIAEGPPTGEDVLRGWLDSPPHRENLEQCDFTHHGVGKYEGYWTHLLLVPAPA